MSDRQILYCDVFVVGGGIAACFAAIKAREAGADVIMADKGRVGNSGQSPYAGTLLVYNKEWGHDLDAVSRNLNKASEYINNRYWGERTALDSYARFLDMQAWGVEFEKDKNGKYITIPEFGPESERLTLKIDERHTGRYGALLRKQAEKVGVRILDKVMIAELLKEEGRICGGVGLPSDSTDLIFVVSKTTILCVGACGLKPTGYPPLVQLTGDGEGMAYRAGAEIVGKEFVDVHHTISDLANMLSHDRATKGLGNICEDLSTVLEDPKRLIPPGIPPISNVNGEPASVRPDGASKYPFSYEDLAFQVDAGNAPFNAEGKAVMGGATLGMAIRKADGLWPADYECRSSLPGLFAAGDALGTMQNGAVYSLPGGAIGGGAVTGTIAGEAAAKECQGIASPSVSDAELLRAEKEVLAPTYNRGGFSPRWLMWTLHNTMMPYYVSYITSGKRLEAALTMVEFMQERIVPKLLARDPHELRLAIETRNMVLSTEMRLRSALFRTESRGNHYREDYPYRDDANWLAWTKIRSQNGVMTLTKVPIPEEWKPDMSLSYRERYPKAVPGEDAYLQNNQQGHTEV